MNDQQSPSPLMGEGRVRVSKFVTPSPSSPPTRGGELFVVDFQER